MDQGTRRATERTNQACTPEARATSSCRRDNGFSLVEVLVSIVLLGTAGVAILGAVGASAQGATTHRQQADSQAVIAAGSEVLMGIKPVACTAAAATYLPVIQARIASLHLAGWSGANISIQDVKEWKNGVPQNTCTNAVAPVNPQLVTIKVTSSDNLVSKIVQIMTASNPTTTVPIGSPFAWNNSIFNVITEGDAFVATQVYGAMAVGGDLRWGAGAGAIAANSAGTFTFNGLPVSLVVQGQVRFDQSSGVQQLNNGNAVIGNVLNGQLFLPGGANCWAPLLATSCNNAPTRVSLQANGTVTQGFPIDFAAAFDGFRKTSAGFAGLPGTCVDAAAAVLRNANDNGPYPGSGNFVIHLTANKLNVINMATADLAGLASGSANGGSDSATHVAPLLINVTDSGAINFSAPTFTQNYPQYVIWNFPNATSVNITGVLWGSLYAPNSAVQLGADIRGIVIAKNIQANPQATDWNQRPDITTACQRTG